MKSLSELAAIRDRMKGQIGIRSSEDSDTTRIVVGMATCGIAAGARPVLNEFVELAAKSDGKVVVTQTGCIGICQYEPVVEVMVPGKDKVTYVKMTAEKAKKVYADHIIGGNAVAEYTIGANKK